MPTIQEILNYELPNKESQIAITDRVQGRITKHLKSGESQYGPWLMALMSDGEHSVPVMFSKRTPEDLPIGTNLTLYPNGDGKGITVKGPYKEGADNSLNINTLATLQAGTTPVTPKNPSPTSQTDMPTARQAPTSPGIKTQFAKNANAFNLAMIATKAVIQPTWEEIRGKEMSDEEFRTMAISLLINTRPDCSSLPAARIETPDDLRANQPKRQEQPRAVEEPQSTATEEDPDDEVPF